jgi:HEAT repeat protein
MTKFLRRAVSSEPEVVADLVREAKGLLPQDFQTADAQAAVNALLRRVEIIQDRRKKVKLIRMIAHLDEPWVPNVFVELLSDPSEEVRDVAVRELAQHREWADAALYARLQQPPWYAKSAALKILGLRRDPGAVPHVRGLLREPNADVKCAAAWCLGEIGGGEARGLLVKLARDSNPYVRSAAAASLDRICDFKFS